VRAVVFPPPAAPPAAHASQRQRAFFPAESFICAALFGGERETILGPALPHALTQSARALFFPPLCLPPSSLMRLALLLALLGAAHAQVSYYNVSLLWGQPGVSGTVAQGRLNKPQGLAVTGAGDVLVADYGNYRVANISAGNAAYVAGKSTPGYKNGALAASELCGPQGLAWDSDLGLIVTDACSINVGGCFYYYSSIRKILDQRMSTIGIGTPPASGSCLCSCTSAAKLTSGCWEPCRTIAYKDGKLFTAAFNDPKGATISGRGDLYLVDSDNHAIRKVSIIDPATTDTETLAGSSPAGFVNALGTAAKFSFPSDISRGYGDDYWIADTGNSAIRLLVDSINGATVYTVGGGGPGPTAIVNTAAIAGLSASLPGPGRFSSPRAVRFFRDAGRPNGVAYVADTGNKVSAPGLPGLPFSPFAPSIAL
jgi:hypothetical protein